MREENHKPLPHSLRVELGSALFLRSQPGTGAPKEEEEWGATQPNAAPRRSTTPAGAVGAPVKRTAADV